MLCSRMFRSLERRSCLSHFSRNRIRTWNAPRLLSARSVDLVASPRSGLRVVFFAFLALGFELRVLLLRQDSFCLLHVFRFARFGATGFFMLYHNRLHLRLLLRCEVEAGQ